jgi:alkylation response protein AidB-like acyl-CoA dehydrogenase
MPALDGLIAGLDALAPEIAARAAEIEAGRRIPEDLVRRLRAMGVFRLVVSAEHGGLGLDQREVCEALAALARLEGAIGWVSLIATAGAMALGQLPRSTFERVYAEGPDVASAGASAASGEAEIVNGGYRVTGRWALASGCDHADWMFGSCVIKDSGATVMREGGVEPLVRMVFVRAERWRIEDTWRAHGLKGTGSHHVALEDVFVPVDQAVDLATAEPQTAAPLYRRLALRLLPTHHAAFAVGMAEGGLRELASLAVTAPRRALNDSVLGQYAVGRAEASVRAARAALLDQAEADTADSAQERLGDLAGLVRRAQASAWATEVSLEAIETCYRLAGSAAAYEACPLQRRLRDMRTAAQHLWAQQRHYAPAGALRLGHPAANPALA